MLRWLAITFAVAAVLLASDLMSKAAPFRASTHGSSGLARSTGTALQSKAARNRSGAWDARSGGHAGANPTFHFGNHESSGWYQHGFGGTGDPGWGYNFGPHLGGFGR